MLLAFPTYISALPMDYQLSSKIAAVPAAGAASDLLELKFFFALLTTFLDSY